MMEKPWLANCFREEPLSPSTQATMSVQPIFFKWEMDCSVSGRDPYTAIRLVHIQPAEISYFLFVRKGENVHVHAADNRFPVFRHDRMVRLDEKDPVVAFGKLAFINDATCALSSSCIKVYV